MRRGLKALALVTTMLVAVCGGGGAPEEAAEPGLDLDACSLLTEDDAADLVGGEVGPPTTGGLIGAAVGCTYGRVGDDPDPAGGAVGGAVADYAAQLRVEESDEPTTDALLTKVSSDITEAIDPEKDTVTPAAIGEGGFVVRSNDRVQVVYVVRNVVVTLDILPVDEVDDDKVGAVFGLAEKTVEFVVEAIDEKALGGPGAVVLGSANIYLALADEDPDDPVRGTRPPVIDLDDLGSPETVRFRVEGSVGCCGEVPDIGPDGIPAGSDIAGEGGIAGFRADRQLPLVGLFLGEDDPDEPEGQGPAQTADAATIATELGQPFMIGDGRDAENETVTVEVPEGATRLAVGFADGFGFGGTAATYQDNRGALRVTLV